MFLSRAYPESHDSLTALYEAMGSVQDRMDLVREVVTDQLIKLYSGHNNLKLLFDDHEPLSISQAFLSISMLAEREVLSEQAKSSVEKKEDDDCKEGGVHPSLQLSYPGQHEELQRRKVPLDASDIFPAELPSHYHVIIQGRAGIGKTTFSKFVSYCSAVNEDQKTPNSGSQMLREEGGRGLKDDALAEDVLRSGAAERSPESFDALNWTKLFKGVITVPLRFLNEFEEVKENFYGLSYSAEKGYLAEFLLKNF